MDVLNRALARRINPAHGLACGRAVTYRRAIDLGFADQPDIRSRLVALAQAADVADTEVPAWVNGSLPPPPPHPNLPSAIALYADGSLTAN